MASDPDLDVVSRLVTTLGGVAFTADTNLFRGPVRAPSQYIPHRAIFALATGGRPPQSFLDNSGTDYNFSTVQVRIRSNEHAFIEGQTIAKAVRDRLHKASMVGYIEVRVREAEPIPLGFDEEGHHEWAVNVEMEHRR